MMMGARWEYVKSSIRAGVSIPLMQRPESYLFKNPSYNVGPKQ